MTDDIRNILDPAGTFSDEDVRGLLAFDPQNSYGTERVGTSSVSETVCVRFNWNASTTIQKGKAYFAGVLTDGPISRINFCTIPERPIGSEMPVYGSYDEHFQAELKPYIDRLNAARGLIECPKATALAKKLMEENVWRKIRKKK